MLTSLHPGLPLSAQAQPGPRTHSTRLYSGCQQALSLLPPALVRGQKPAGGLSTQAKNQEAQGSVPRRLGGPTPGYVYSLEEK